MMATSPFLSIDFFFLLGAALLGLVVWPRPGLIQLRTVFMIGMILAYGGPSIVELLGEPYPAVFLLVPRLVPLLQRLGAVCCLGFWMGYWVRLRLSTRRDLKQTQPIKTTDENSIPPPAWLLVGLASIPFFMALIRFGASALLGISTEARGAGQVGFIINPGGLDFAYVLSRVLIVAIPLPAGVAWAKTKRPIYILAAILPSIELIALFSRGMFLPGAMFVLGSQLFERGHRRKNVLLLVGCVTLFGFVLGVVMREAADTPGLGRYTEMLQQGSSSDIQSHGALTPLVELVRATTPVPLATKVLEVGPSAEGHMVLGYLLRPLPIPSFLMPSWVPKSSLSFDLNIYAMGLPYPLMPEVWVFFGWAGALLFVILGFGAAAVDHAVILRQRDGYALYRTAIIYGLSLFFVIHSFHSSLRVSSRPLMYFMIVWCLWALVAKRKKSIATRHQGISLSKALGKKSFTASS